MSIFVVKFRKVYATGGKMIINIILVFLSAFALCKTINYTRNEDFSISTNKCIALMGLFVVLWCSGYAVVGISTDFSIAMVARTVGYTSVWGYLITEVYFVIRSSKLLENKLKYIIAFFSLLCILDIIYYAASDSIEFVRLQGRTSFYLEAGMASTIHNVIAIAFFVFLFPIALRWLKKSTLKRDKRIIWYLILSNFSIIIGATFDTIMPILGRPVFPMSGVGAFLPMLSSYMWQGNIIP